MKYENEHDKGTNDPSVFFVHHINNIFYNLINSFCLVNRRA